MKKLIFPLIIIITCILSAAVCMAADEINLHADFDNYDVGQTVPKEFIVGVRSDVAIEQTDDSKVLRIAHTNSDKASSANMLSTDNLDFSSETIITFDVQNRNADTGNLNVQLRSDNGNTAVETRNVINIISINNGQIAYLPQMVSVSETISTSRMAKITFIVNPETGRILLYDNGVLRVSIDDFYTLRGGSWKEFDFSKTIFRMQNYVKATPESVSTPYVTDIIYDNIRIAQGTGDVFVTSAKAYYDTSFTTISEAKNGPLTARASLLNKGDTAKKVKVFFAHKQGGVLKAVQAADYTLSPFETTYVSRNMTVDDSKINDTVEIMVFEPDTLTPLMAPKVVYLKNLIETPIEEEMEYLYNQRQIDHPRVIATKKDFDTVRALAKTDATVMGWADEIFALADEMAQADIYSSSSKYYITHQLTATDSLSMSRRVLNMMQTLGLAHQLNGEQTSPYSEKAAEVLIYAGLFSDWGHSASFLTTGEMMAAFAIGYDWMYDAFDQSTRQFVEERVYQKGLYFAKQAYDGSGGTENTGWWKKVYHNWNPVCNGGTAIAAVAFADVYPDLAFELSSKAVNNIKSALGGFAPHGAYDESFEYAIYAMEYFARCISTMENTFGTDFGMLEHTGLSQIGNYLIQVDGSAGTNNYHDANAKAPHVDTFCMTWFGKVYNQPRYSAARLRNIEKYNLSPNPLDLIWYNPNVTSDDFTGVPIDSYFAGTEIISMRSGFDDDDIFLSAHGGKANLSHSHLDGGSFVLDMLGTRFAGDIGAEGYSKEGYSDYDEKRWEFYRARPEGHNTIVINPDSRPGQSTNCSLPFEKTNFTGDNPFAILNMTTAYSDYGASSAKRGYMLCDNRTTAVIRDEVELAEESTVYWFMQTQADVAVDGNTLTLTKDGKTITAQFVTNGEESILGYGAAEPLPESNSTVDSGANPTYKRVYFKTTANGSLNITVKFTPSSGDFADIQNINALSQW